MNDSFVVSVTFLSTQAKLIQYYVRSYNMFYLVTHVIQIIIGPEHGLGHVSAGMIIDLSYFGTKIPLLIFSCRKQTGM